MVSIGQYPADVPGMVRASLVLGSGINAEESTRCAKRSDNHAYLIALQQAQACILAYATAYEQILRLGSLPQLPGVQHESSLEAHPCDILQDYTTSNALATAHLEHQLDHQDLSRQAYPKCDRGSDIFDIDRQTQPQIDLSKPDNLREHAKKKKKAQAAKNAWADSDDEGEKKADEGEKGGDGGDGDNKAGAGGSDGGEDPNEGGDGGGGGGGGGDDDNDWDFGGSKKKGKKAKKKNVFSWDAVDDEDTKEGEDGGETAAAIDEPAVDTAAADDDWGGFQAAGKKKKKKGKNADTGPEPDPIPSENFDEVNLDEGSAPKIDLDFGGTNDVKSGGGWGSGWGSSNNKWGFSTAGDADQAEGTPAETGLEDTWSGFAGKKDKKKKGTTFDFDFGAGAGADGLADGLTGGQAEDKATEDDPWAGFSTSKKKKKKGGTSAFEESPPSPPDSDPVAEPETQLVDAESGAADDTWGGWGMSAKDKKKAKKAAKKGGLQSPDAEPEPELEPEPETAAELEPEPVLATNEEPSNPVDEPVLDDDTWGGFTTSKKKKKKVKNAAPEPEPEPEPEPPAPEPPIEPEPFVEPAEDLTTEPVDEWGGGFMSAKDKKKAAKKAAKAGSLISPPLETEPIVIPDMIEPPIAPDSETVDDFSWGMSAKDKKKAKKAAKVSAFTFGSPPAEEQAPVTEDVLAGDGGANVEDSALVVAEPPAEPAADDWFSGWGASSKKKKGKKGATEDVLPEAPPPPPVVPEPAPEPAVEANDNDWSFGWGQSKKDKKKKGKDVEPEPEPELETLALDPEPVVHGKDDVIMIPESVDEPTAEVNDDWGGGWGAGTKKKKKGKKDIAVEVTEPSPDIPVQQPDPLPEAKTGDDPWGWTTGKKDKKKGAKKGSAFDITPSFAPTPPEPSLEAPTSESTMPAVQESLVDVSEPVRSTEDDSWAAFTTTTTKKDKKKKKGKTEDTILDRTLSEEKPTDEFVATTNVPALSSDPGPEGDDSKDDTKNKKKDKDKDKDKSEKGGSGWGSIWGSGGVTSKSSKEKEKEKGKEKEKERDKEAERKAEEEAAFAAALGAESNDLLDVPLPEAVVEEPSKVEPAAGWGFWGTSLKPTKKANLGPEIAAEPLANKPMLQNENVHAMREIGDADEVKTSRTKLKAGAKGSVADRIKALQTGGSGAAEDKKSRKKSEDDPAPQAAPDPAEPPPAPRTEPAPEPQVAPAMSAQIDESVTTKKSSSKDKDKDRKKAKSSKREKESSPPPNVTPLVEPAVLNIVSAPSPIPGGFPEEEPQMPGAVDAPKAPSTEKKSSKEHKTSKSTSKSSSKKENKLARDESQPSSGGDLLHLQEKPVKPSALSPEPQSVRKERPKVIRDQGGSSWGFWGSTAKADPREERRRDRRTRDDDPSPAVDRTTAPGLSRSKSARKPTERDRLEPVDRSSGSDKAKRHSRERPSAPRGMSFSGIFSTPTQTPSRSKSTRHSSSAPKSSHARRSLDVEGGLMSPPSDDIDPAKISSKAAQLMGLSGKRPSRRDSTRNHAKPREVPDPYAIDDDMIIVDTPEDGAGLADHSGKGHRQASSHRKTKRDSLYMSGGLEDEPVLIDAHGPSDGPEVVTGPDDIAFVGKPVRPSAKRNASSAKKTTGLFGGLLGSLRPNGQTDDRRRSRALESEDGASRRRRQTDDDDEGSRRLRRDGRKIHRSKTSDADGLHDATPTAEANGDEEADAEKRRIERRARRAERNAAETAETEQREARRREKERVREEERHARRIRFEEDTETTKQEEKRARHAARRSAEEQEGREAERRAKRHGRESDADASRASHADHSYKDVPKKAEDEDRRVRREERRVRHEKERARPSRHRSDNPAHVEDYFDVRNGANGDYAGRAGTVPADTRPYLSDAPDKTSSWVNSVNEDPPPPPPEVNTIIGDDPPAQYVEAGLDVNDGTAENTARELRRKHRRERERNGEENSSDERRRRRREEKRREHEAISGDGSAGDKTKRSSKAYNSLGFADMSAKTFDGRPSGGTGEKKGWLKKIAGL